MTPVLSMYRSAFIQTSWGSRPPRKVAATY